MAKRLANSVIRDGVLFVGFVVVAICILATVYAVGYLWQQHDTPLSNCRVTDLGRQRVLIDDKPHFANVTTTYCNPTPEGAN